MGTWEKTATYMPRREASREAIPARILQGLEAGLLQAPSQLPEKAGDPGHSLACSRISLCF